MMQEVEKLIGGYQRFYKKYFDEQPELYEGLFKEGQFPKFLVISCCDSRVHPAQVMDTAPGDIFVIRNVANLVPVNEVDDSSHGTSAAIEFAVKHLAVKHIIVLGHSQCGGIKSLMEGDHLGEAMILSIPGCKLPNLHEIKLLRNMRIKPLPNSVVLVKKHQLKFH